MICTHCGKNFAINNKSLCLHCINHFKILFDIPTFITGSVEELSP